MSPILFPFTTTFSRKDIRMKIIVLKSHIFVTFSPFFIDNVNEKKKLESGNKL